MSQVVEQANDLVSEGRVLEAASLLQRANENGDGGAAYVLANWRLTGAVIRRDLGMARDLFVRAAELGLHDAEDIATALLANGAGGTKRYWREALGRLQKRAGSDATASRQLKLLSEMQIDEQGEPAVEFRGTQRAIDPEISTFSGFLSQAECAYLIDLALPRLQPAVVIHPETGALIRDAVRSATSTGFPFVAEDPVIHAINRRLARATATGYEQGEPLQVLSYEPSQEYKLHSDALPHGSNQRVATFLVYLNDDYLGGETSFPDLHLRVRGQTGDGLMFCNVDARGRPHPHGRHAGLPVTKGRKMLLSKWIRAKPLDISGPPGRPL
jgi:prolyl 4-hydroxylase